MSVASFGSKFDAESEVMITRIAPHNSNILLILPGIAVGFIVFGIIYGFGPLNVANDKWIMSGYDESDIIQHYAGWCLFRNSAWHFPLGLADNIGGGTYISFTDSIPWVAIFFKFILSIFNYNGTFQYFGIYGLLCYILQAVAAGLLIRRKTSNPFIIFMCMVLLSFSPILMERSLRHTALGSQWLILFAMYAYLKFRDRQCCRFPVAFGLLAFLAVGIHPYFLPTVLVFSFLSILSSIYRKTNLALNFGGFACSIIFPVVGGYLIGALGSGVVASRWGYGHFSMNINAVVNPTSIGHYDWSSFLKVHPQILGNYDGFNYLGLGYLFLILLAVLGIAVNSPKWNRQKQLDAATYIAVAIGMTAFAISNVVTFNDKVIANIHLPEAILNLCGIFRASSRIFYFTYYSLVIFSLYIIFDTFSAGRQACPEKNRGNAVTANLPVGFAICLSIISLLQFADIGQTVIQKNTAMSEKLKFQSIIDDRNLSDAVKGKHYLISDSDDRSLAVFAGKNNLATSFSIANSGEYSAEVARATEMLSAFVMGIHKDDVVVAYRDIGLARELFQNKEISSTSKYYESSGFAFIVADKDTETGVRDPTKYTVKPFTDETWTRGIKNEGNTLLFDYSDRLLEIVNHAGHVETGENRAAITHIDVIGTSWIWVAIDKDARPYAYPHVIHFSD